MDPDLGGPKTCGSGAGSSTLVPQIWLLDPDTDPEKPWPQKNEELMF